MSKVIGASAVSVNLATEQARVQAPSDSLPALMDAVQQAGYSVPQQSLELSIDGMTCASCVGRVERALAKVPGVKASASTSPMNAPTLSCSARSIRKP